MGRNISNTSLVGVHAGSKSHPNDSPCNTIWTPILVTPVVTRLVVVLTFKILGLFCDYYCDFILMAFTSKKKKIVFLI